ncbi:anti-sigma factor [Tateyamaria armeniaca]|uniref:Anti-sigma factor n=1 Tax=Tateyamaria armeniaca TaxID=2518930 RepID=A0ABW8UVQ4_9RHOB
MSAARTFSDEDLTAFLDGEADDALEAAISAALETDEALAERMAGLEVPMAAIAGAYDELLASAPPMPALAPVLPEPANTNARLSWAWGLGTFGTGIAAGLAVALFTGFGTPEPAPRGWVSFVASYQTLYTTATLEDVSPSAQEAAVQLAAVSEGIGIDLAALPQTEGLTFKRAQLLGFNGKPLVQISYLRDDGTPVALCIIPAGPDAQGLNMGAAEGLDVARWNTPGYGFLLIGGQEGEPLQREAETFQQWSQDIAT